jgi:peptidoglycan/LPS O-acetylase OafA/YrhL
MTMRLSDLFPLVAMAAVRSPRKVLVIVLLFLVALASTMSYVGYLVVTMLASQLGTSRFLAGLLLGVVFARFPRIRDGKLGTMGLLPKPARQPVMAALLVFCLVNYLMRGQFAAVGFLGFALVFLLGYGQLKKAVAGKVSSFIFPFGKAGQAGSQPGSQPGLPQGPGPRQGPGPQSRDDVIDVDFREKND